MVLNLIKILSKLLVEYSRVGTHVCVCVHVYMGPAWL